MLRKTVSAVMAGVFAAGVCLMNVNAADATSVKWGVHAQPGYYKETQVVSMKNNKNGYVATCDTEGGDVPFKAVDISLYSDPNCLEEVPVKQILEFTCSEKSITFQPDVMPKGDKVYMKISLVYSNGLTASFSGTIRANGSL